MGAFGFPYYVAHIGDALKWGVGERWLPTNPLAGTTPFEPRNVTTYFDRAVTKAGVPEITFHGMRHTLLLEHGADPLAVADRLALSLQVLLNTYRHVLDRRKDRAAGVARSLFGVPNEPT